MERVAVSPCRGPEARFAFVWPPRLAPSTLTLHVPNPYTAGFCSLHGVSLPAMKKPIIFARRAAELADAVAPAAIALSASLLFSFAMSASVSCTPAGLKNVSNVVSAAVSAAEFACIEGSALSDAKEIAVACSVVKSVSEATPDILAFIEKLITRRDMLKSSGYSYEKQSAVWTKH